MHNTLSYRILKGLCYLNTRENQQETTKGWLIGLRLYIGSSQLWWIRTFGWVTVIIWNIKLQKARNCTEILDHFEIGCTVHLLLFCLPHIPKQIQWAKQYEKNSSKINSAYSHPEVLNKENTGRTATNSYIFLNPQRTKIFFFGTEI